MGCTSSRSSSRWEATKTSNSRWAWAACSREAAAAAGLLRLAGALMGVDMEEGPAEAAARNTNSRSSNSKERR